jgi:hypothetical protein
MTAEAQQPAAKEQQPSRKAQPPRFNYRVMTNFEDQQVQNIATLKQKLGGSDNSVIRTALDVFAFLNGLPVKIDPTLYLNDFLVRQNNGRPQS